MDLKALNAALRNITDDHISAYTGFATKELFIELDGHFSLAELETIVATVKQHQQAST